MTAASKAPSSTNNKHSTSKKSTTAKKEKIFHPESRKASQLNRKAVRKSRLGNLSSERGKKHNSLADYYGFFYHSLPSQGELTLSDLHSLIKDVWLTRHDEELEAEQAARRKGRPKSVKETKLEEIKLREMEEYRTGIEVIDLTDPPTVSLFRRWDQKEVAYIQLLRFIRISSTSPSTFVVSKPGKHISITGSNESSLSDGREMDIDSHAEGGFSSSLLNNPGISSTMMTMDDPVI